MKKKLIACISLFLVLIFTASISPMAITYECNVDVNSNAVLVANLESDTIVYEHRVDAQRYASNMVELVDFLVVMKYVKDPVTETIEITQELIDDIPESDGTLNDFVGRTLTIKDLITIMLMTEGNDAAYLLAVYTSNNDYEWFIDKLNETLYDLGCSRSVLVSPRPIETTEQLMTCSDIYKVIKEAMKYDLFVSAASRAKYNLDDNPDGSVKDNPDVVTNNSMKKYDSPYYFSYIKQSKYGYGEKSRQNAASIGTFEGYNYVVVALGGPNDTEKNAMTDTKLLLTWAFTELENVKILSKDTTITEANVDTLFGEDTIELTVKEDIIRTLPQGYNSEDIKISYDLPEKISLPVFIGEKVGNAIVTYQDSLLKDFSVVSSASKGVSLIDDVGSAIKGVFNELLVSDEESTEVTEELDGTVEGTDENNS